MTDRSTSLWTRPFALTFVAHFLHALALLSYVHLPGFLQDLGADESGIGIIVGTMAATAIAVRPLVGRVLDRAGRRVVLVAGGWINAVACAAYLGVVDLGPWLYGVRVIHGIGEGMLFSVLFTIAADVTPPKRRAEGIAIFGISGMIPFAVGGVIGDLVLADGNYDRLFAFTAASAALGALVSMPVPDSRPPQARPPRPVLVAAMDRALLPLWLVGLSFALGFSSYFTFIKTFLRQNPVTTPGAYFTVYAAAAVALRVLLGWVPDRVGPKRALVPALFSLSIGLGILATSPGIVGVLVAALFCGIGHGYAFPVVSAMALGRVGDEERGAAMAVFTALQDLGILLGGPVLGLVVERAGYGTMFATAAAIVVTGTAGFLVWDRRRRG